MNSLLRILWVVSIFSFSGFAATQTTFYVSPSGTGDFSLASPGPLSGILAKVRTINTNMTGDIVVNLRGGRYDLASTFALGATDGGTNNNNVIYQAYPGETPVLSGGQQITGWTLSDQAKNIYSVNVGTTIDSRQLYVNGVRAWRARTAKEGHTWELDNTGWIIQNKAQNTNNAGVFTCPAEVASWQNKDRIEVVINTTWSNHRSKISSVSGTTAQGTGFIIWSPGLTYVTWVENAYELLDAAGEWYLNRTTGILYYKPRAGENMSTAEVILAKLETLVSGTGVNHVQFKGITFAYATWLYPNTNGMKNGQGDVYDGSYSRFLAGNITFSTSSYIRFENNIFTHLGSTALRFASGSYNTVYNNTFQDISASGISIGDSRTPSLTTYTTVDNNLIRDCTVEYKGSHGIFGGCSDHTVITHNDIIKTNYSGIAMGLDAGRPGNTNMEISYNKVDTTMLTLWDGAPIYTKEITDGSTIHDNYLHFAPNGHMMYPDERSSNAHWYNNVTWNTAQAGGFYVNIWTTSIHDLTFDHNWYSGKAENNAGTNCTFSNNTNVTGAWPSAAQAIIDNAGRVRVPTSVIAQNIQNENRIMRMSLGQGTHKVFSIDGKEVSPNVKTKKARNGVFIVKPADRPAVRVVGIR